MKDRKGIDLDGRGGGVEIGGVEGRGNLIRIYLVRKELEKNLKKINYTRKCISKKEITHAERVRSLLDRTWFLMKILMAFYFYFICDIDSVSSPAWPQTHTHSSFRLTSAGIIGL